MVGSAATDSRREVKTFRQCCWKEGVEEMDLEEGKLDMVVDLTSFMTSCHFSNMGGRGKPSGRSSGGILEVLVLVWNGAVNVDLDV